MANREIAQAFVAAADIAKKVPKHLQEAAFNRALDHLLAPRAPAPDSRQARVSRKSTEVVSVAASHARDLLSQIDRTRYPDVGTTARIADRALKVLQLADADLGVDGLSAAEIADILTKKFRLPVRANSIIKALERENETVDIRHSGERGRTFHLMAPGEDYLARLRAGEAPARGRQRGTPVKHSGAARKSTGKREKAAPRSVRPAPKRTSGRPGPKAAVGQLISSGFFKTARTISEIQGELKHKRGHSYTLQELAPALVRSLRDQTLLRERNSSGQYEYTGA